MFVRNFVKVDKDEATFTDNCFIWKNEKYCKTVTTSTTISPSIAPSSSVPIQGNTTDLIRSVDVLLLGVAILFLAIALIMRQKSASLKHELIKWRKVREALHNEIRSLKEQRAQSELHKPPLAPKF